jgi:hypothetical protein
VLSLRSRPLHLIVHKAFTIRSQLVHKSSKKRTAQAPDFYEKGTRNSTNPPGWGVSEIGLALMA